MATLLDLPIDIHKIILDESRNYLGMFMICKQMKNIINQIMPEKTVYKTNGEIIMIYKKGDNYKQIVHCNYGKANLKMLFVTIPSFMLVKAEQKFNCFKKCNEFLRNKNVKYIHILLDDLNFYCLNLGKIRLKNFNEKTLPLVEKTIILDSKIPSYRKVFTFSVDFFDNYVILNIRLIKSEYLELKNLKLKFYDYDTKLIIMSLGEKSWIFDNDNFNKSLKSSIIKIKNIFKKLRK